MKKIIIAFINIIFICSNGYAADSYNNTKSDSDNVTIDKKDEKAEKDEKEPLLFSEIWARSSSTSNSAIYLKINNNSVTNYTLIGASAISVANNVEIHQSYVDEKGVSRMTSVDKILIPAQTEVELTPGGMHIMLFDLKRKLNADDKFKLNLTFEILGTKTVDVVVKDS